MSDIQKLFGVDIKRPSVYNFIKSLGNSKAQVLFEKVLQDECIPEYFPASALFMVRADQLIKYRGVGIKTATCIFDACEKFKVRLANHEILEDFCCKTAIAHNPALDEHTENSIRRNVLVHRLQLAQSRYSEAATEEKIAKSKYEAAQENVIRAGDTAANILHEMNRLDVYLKHLSERGI